MLGNQWSIQYIIATALPGCGLYCIGMKKELYVDISNEEAGGSLYRVTGDDGSSYFYYNHSTYNSDKDELKVFEDNFADFDAFWKHITRDKKWFYLHPLFIHPEQRAFIKAQLAGVNWASGGDKKWQESHQRQWKKVLTDPGSYYSGPR